MELIFHTASGSIGVASHITLEESGLPYELVQIDFSSKDQLSDRYTQLNPKQRVPTLVVDGQPLSETPAILVYLAQVAPASSIALPADPFASASVQSFNSYLCSTVHVAHAHRMRGTRWTDDQAAMAAMTAFVPTSMSKCFELIETEYLQGPWVHGDEFSISDPYLFAITRWLEGDGVDITRYPKVQRHHDSMMMRESVRTVIAAG